MSVKIPKHLEKQREVTITKEELISFETLVRVLEIACPLKAVACPKNMVSP